MWILEVSSILQKPTSRQIGTHLEPGERINLKVRQVRDLYNLRRSLESLRRGLHSTWGDQLVLLSRNPENLRGFGNVIEQSRRTKLAVHLAAPHINLAAKREAAVNFSALPCARPLDAVFQHLRRNRHGAARAKPACATHLRHYSLHSRVQRGYHQHHARAIRRSPDADAFRFNAWLGLDVVNGRTEIFGQI